MRVDALDAHRPVRAVVDLSRLAANYQAVARLVSASLMPVVKADAYGHGAVPVARHLVARGASILAVAYVEEAIVLRKGGIAVPIVVLSGFTAGQMEAIAQQDLSPVVGSRDTLGLLLGRRAAGSRLSVHLKVDTGMTRLGLPPSEALAAADALAAAEGIELAGLMTHLASADEDPDATRKQLDLFDAVIEKLASRGIRPRHVHAANSAGLAFHRPHYTLARTGLLLYGVRPRPLSPEVDVAPVMTVTADVIAIRDVPAGTRVSYGGRWQASRPSRIAVVPVGYADGLPRARAMSERGFVTRGGARVGVAGAVCMDLTMLDVTDCPDAKEGDRVVLLGDEPTAWDLASWSDGNAWESLTRVAARIPRVYVENGRVIEVRTSSGSPLP
jgi:alanine racemase